VNWMNWQPQPQIIPESPKSEPPKPTKPGFVGFGGSCSGQNEKIQVRLARAGISIAVDKNTGAALLVFNESEAQTVRDVAEVHKPFDIELTDRQRRELTADLEYYESILWRRTQTKTD